MAISSRYIAFASKLNNFISLRSRAQKRSCLFSFKHDYNSRSNAGTIIFKPRESYSYSLVSKSRYGTNYSQNVLKQDAIIKILTKNESYVNIKENIIKFVETNQLPANDPIEDMHTVGKLVTNDGFMFGVFDGHNGKFCSQYVSECLFFYIGIYLAKHDNMKSIVSELDVKRKKPLHEGSIKWIQSLPHEVVHEADDFFIENLRQISSERLKSDDIDTMELIKAAFVRLDRDLTNGPLINKLSSQLKKCLMETSISGSCATLAYVNNRNLYVANTGNCRAVIGTTNERGEITANEITLDHYYKNTDEVRRLCENRQNELSTVMKKDRLLGQLVPLRAFGNIPFKWSLDDLKDKLKPSFPEFPNLIPSDYLTPPYLTAEPEVFHHQLTKDDKFLVLATPGLWHELPSSLVVLMVADHMKEFKGAARDTAGTSLTDSKNKDLNSFYDRNCATFLIRNILGLYDEDVSLQLTLPAKVVKQSRDDITVTIVYFDENY